MSSGVVLLTRQIINKIKDRIIKLKKKPPNPINIATGIDAIFRIIPRAIIPTTMVPKLDINNGIPVLDKHDFILALFIK
jgi:hypothetical protein